MASLGVLTSGVAHEINNPLNYISGGLQNIESLIENITDENSNMEQKEYAKNRIKKILPGANLGVNRISRIINSLISFSNQPENNKVNINRLIDSTLQVIAFKLPEDTQIVKKYDDYIPEAILHQDKMNQILLEVIDNASFYLQEAESKKLIIQTQLKTEDRKKKIAIKISNSGSPIPENILNKIFDPFFTTKPTGQGAGLGLTNCYNIVKGLKGTIYASNTNNMVEFLINIPIKEIES